MSSTWNTSRVQCYWTRKEREHHTHLTDVIVDCLSCRADICKFKANTTVFGAGAVLGGGGRNVA